MNLKSEKAITLVALIITIIILLILAGVTLNMVLGDNSLINKSQSSVDKYKESANNEQDLLNSIENFINQYPYNNEENKHPYELGQIFNYDYTGKAEEFEAYPGIYKLEVWGAQGGGSNGGKGGYSVGTIEITSKTKFLIYVGGSTSGAAGGFNGGGTNTAGQKYGGGGASDIRIEQDSLYARVIVAGGGGGMNTNGGRSDSGGYGGGTTGGYGATPEGSNYRRISSVLKLLEEKDTQKMAHLEWAEVEIISMKLLEKAEAAGMVGGSGTGVGDNGAGRRWLWMDIYRVNI